MADMVDGVDDIIELREIELFNIAPGYQVIDRDAVTLRINRNNALTQHLDLGASDAVAERVQLSIAITDIDVVVIDQRDVSNARARASFGGPGTDSADTDDAKMRLLQGL